MVCPMRLQRSHPAGLSRRGFRPSSRVGPALLAVPPTAGWAAWGWTGLAVASGIVLLVFALLLAGVPR